MATTGQVRKTVRAILDRHGLSNKISVRTVSFSDLARDRVMVVTIRRWTPSPKAKDIKAAIERRHVGVLVNFDF